uniref:CG10887-PA n=1 Tax=Drosophila erecta TaxID=7220 RepID=Q8I1G1_DROER|nr:CG10887-PA [Drosophila erecta]
MNNHQTGQYANRSIPLRGKSPYDLNAQTSSQSDEQSSTVSSSSSSSFKFPPSSESKSSSSTSPSSKSSLTPNEQNVENNAKATWVQSSEKQKSLTCSKPKPVLIISNELLRSSTQIDGTSNCAGETDDQGSIDSDIILSIRNSTSLIELKDNCNTFVDEDHNQENNEGGPVSSSNFGCQSEESIAVLTSKGELPTQIYCHSLNEVGSGESKEMELELRSRQYYSSTPKIGGRKMIIENQHYGENKDTEKELSALQYSSILPSQSKTETEILKPVAISVPSLPFSANFDECPNWNSECKSNGGNRSQDTNLPDLPYSTDTMESNALVYSSSESLDIMCDVDNNPENHQLAGRGNADKDSPDKELYSNRRMQTSQVLDTSHSVEDEQRKMFEKEVAVKFQSTIPADNCGLLNGPTRFLKMPYFIPVESKAYEPQNLENRMTKDDLKDDQARVDFINRLKATVRWREDENKIKESNSKIVRWSDGSETFHVGDEVFDVMHHPVNDSQNHFYVRLASCYQHKGSIKDKMTLRPMLDSSFGQSHVQGLRNRATNKPQTGFVKVIMDMDSNPEQDQEKLKKQELAKLRQEQRESRRAMINNRHLKRGKPTKGSDCNVAKTPGTSQEDDYDAAEGEASFEEEDVVESMDLEEADDDDMDDGPSCSKLKSKEENESISEDDFPIGGAIRKPRRLVYFDYSD